MLLFIGLFLFITRKDISYGLRFIKQVSVKNLHKQKTISLLLFLVVLQVSINLIGVLGPELAFDALWYHLTLPKIYLEKHSLFLFQEVSFITVRCQNWLTCCTSVD